MRDVPPGWAIPTFQKKCDGSVVIIDPPHLRGMEVLTNDGGRICGLEGPLPRSLCGLIAGHESEHWICSEELVALVDKPFCLRRQPPAEAAS
jgi:hypothetical protein